MLSHVINSHVMSKVIFIFYKFKSNLNTVCFYFTEPHELTFLIISQNYSFSAKLANELKNNILHQLRIEAFLNNNEVSKYKNK